MHTILVLYVYQWMEDVIAAARPITKWPKSLQPRCILRLLQQECLIFRAQGLLPGIEVILESSHGHLAAPWGGAVHDEAALTGHGAQHPGAQRQQHHGEEAHGARHGWEFLKVGRSYDLNSFLIIRKARKHAGFLDENCSMLVHAVPLPSEAPYFLCTNETRGNHSISWLNFDRDVFWTPTGCWFQPREHPIIGTPVNFDPNGLIDLTFRNHAKSTAFKPA